MILGVMKLQSVRDQEVRVDWAGIGLFTAGVVVGVSWGGVAYGGLEGVGCGADWCCGGYGVGVVGGCGRCGCERSAHGAAARLSWLGWCFG